MDVIWCDSTQSSNVECRTVFKVRDPGPYELFLRGGPGSYRTCTWGSVSFERSGQSDQSVHQLCIVSRAPFRKLASASGMILFCACGPTSCAKHATLRAKHSTFRAKHPTFRAKHPTSRAKHPTSRAKDLTFRARHPIFEAKHPNFKAKALDNLEQFFQNF